MISLWVLIDVGIYSAQKQASFTEDSQTLSLKLLSTQAGFSAFLAS